MSHNMWATKVDLAGHCALCLAPVPSSLRDAVLSMDPVWPYLMENWNNESRLAQFNFIVSKVRNEGKRGVTFLQSKVPAMCALCRDSVKTLDKLHQELVEIKRRIETQVNGIRNMMRCDEFTYEEECSQLVKDLKATRVPYPCAKNTVAFLEQLHGRKSGALEELLNSLLEKSEGDQHCIKDKMASIVTSHYLQKQGTEEEPEGDSSESKELIKFVELKPLPSIPDANDSASPFEKNRLEVQNPEVKIEPDSDYENQDVCEPKSPFVDQFLNPAAEAGAEEDVAEASNTSRDLSRRRSRSRGFTKAGKEVSYYEPGTDSDDSDYRFPIDEDYSSEELEEDSNSTSTQLKTPRSQSASKATIATSSSRRPSKRAPVKRNSSRSSSRRDSEGVKRRKKSATGHSKEDRDAEADDQVQGEPSSEMSDQEDDPTSEDDEEYKRATRRRSSKSKQTRAGVGIRRRSYSSVGRPRKHPRKEKKAPVRNTQCEICLIKLPDPKLLFEHLQSHVKEYAHQCPHCNVAFVCRKRMIVKHYRKGLKCRRAAGYPDPPAVIMKRCDTCDFETDSYFTLLAHLNEHDVPLDHVKPYSCPLPDCSETFALRQMVEFHLDKHIGQGTSSAASQKCPICQVAFEYAEMDMKVHLLEAHQITETITCQYCPHSFHNLESLVEHLISHLSIGVMCHLCEEQIHYYKADHVRDHFYSVHQVGSAFCCESCDYMTFSLQNLRNHRAIKHEGKYRKSFTCEICVNPPVVCRSKDVLVSHNIKCHGAKPYCCKLCPATFETRVLWNAHEKSHFGISAKRIHQCPQCDKTFNILGRLQYHISRVHSTLPMERNFKCDQCDKRYLDPHGLKRHVQAIHLGIKYICEECGRSFNEPGPLKNHMRRHTGERPYKCSYCPNDFRYKDAHRRHEDSHRKLGDKFQPGRTFDRKRKPL